MFLNQTERKLREAAEQSLFYFISGILGTEPGFEMLSPVLHLDMCNFLQNPTSKRKLMLVPRDHFKSTLLKGMVLHFLIQPEHNNIYFSGKKGQETCILIGFDNVENATKFVSVVKNVIENHRLFRHFWPHLEPGNRWSQQVCNLKRQVNWGEATLEAVSVNTPVASRHVDVFFKDDIFTFKAMIEPPTAMKTIVWHKSTISVFRQNQHAWEIVAGTPWAQNDVYTSIMNEQPWFAFYHRAAIENGLPIFPERYTLEELDKIRQTLEGTGLFELNYMCDHSGGILSDFKRHWFKSFEFDPGQNILRFKNVEPKQSPLADAIRSAMSGERYDKSLIENALGVTSKEEVA